MLLYTLALCTTPLTPLMSDRADSTIPPSSFSTIEQEIKQAYCTFQADLSPARSSSAQDQDSPSTSSSTPPLILTCDLTLDFERSTLYLSVTMSNPTNQLPSYESNAIAQANSNYFCLPMGHTSAVIKSNQVVVKRENKG